MTLTRREVIKLGVGAGVSMFLPRLDLWAQEGSLLHRVIPSSGERIPAVGIGTAILYNFDPGSPEYTLRREVFKAFVEGGGKVIDTAPSYGNAEVVVGQLMKDLGIRDRLFVATKVGVRGQNQREAGIQQMERSLERLQTDRVDLMQVHNLRDVKTQLATIREWKAEGRVRYVGMTTSSYRQYEDFERTMRDEELDFVQVNYSLAARRAEERILPLAADRGMAVLVNLPFGRGRLFRAVGDRPLPEWAAEFDCATWAQFFLKYILSHPAVTCAIPGTDRPEYAIDNLGAARTRLPDVNQRNRMVDFFDSLS